MGTVPTGFERPRLTDQAVAHMTRMITSGNWPAGAVLAPEGELAQQLGVSRTVICECVRVLASRGMLDVRQGRGTFVTPLAAWNVTEPLALLVEADHTELLRWLEVRSILEVESAALAAQRATAEDGERLRQALLRFEEEPPNPDAYMAADVHFHLTVAQATQNQPLVRLLHPVVQPLRERFQGTVHVIQAREQAKCEHRAIVVAILARDVSAARAAMAAHLGRVADEIVQILRDQELPATQMKHPTKEHE